MLNIVYTTILKRNKLKISLHGAMMMITMILLFLKMMKNIVLISALLMNISQINRTSKKINTVKLRTSLKCLVQIELMTLKQKMRKTIRKKSKDYQIFNKVQDKIQLLSTAYGNYHR